MLQENVEIVRRVFEAHARRDWEAVYACYAPDIEWEGGALWGDWGTAHGRDGVRTAWRRWLEAFEFARFKAEDFIDAGDEVFVRVRMHARGRGSGAETEQVLALVWTLFQGMVVRVRAYADHAEALQAAGLRE